jgi:diaminopimelate epimerase
MNSIIPMSKYNGCGNTFLIILADVLGRILPPRRWGDFAREVCDRQDGVGADGLLVTGREGKNPIMRVYNPDGSVAEMCGNGIRCIADYAVSAGWWEGPSLLVQTDSGEKKIDLSGEGYTVNMGPPIFDPKKIPVNTEDRDKGGCPVVTVDLPETQFGTVHCVSMGNPHAVGMVRSPEQFEEIPLKEHGPIIERASCFPQRTNAEFAWIANKHRAHVKVWERGAGATLACGTGACAVAVVGIRNNLLESPVFVELPGGTLTIEWDGQGDVFMTGPAKKLFDIQYNYREE